MSNERVPAEGWPVSELSGDSSLRVGSIEIGEVRSIRVEDYAAIADDGPPWWERKTW